LVQVGTQEQILDYIKTKNVFSNDKGFNFNKIAWLLQEKDFYSKTVAILRKREIYIEQVWMHSLRHHDTQAISEYISAPGSQYRLNLQGSFKSTLFAKCATLNK